MTIEHFDKWLREAGYKHQCFISYPRVKDPAIWDCANRFKTAIERDLSHLIAEPSVFLDTDKMGGTRWERSLRSALCHSVAMVAICAPIYYQPHHRWCGLEWAAMDRLCEQRLPGEDQATIIPLLVRGSAPLPPPVARIDYIDISQLTLRGGYYRSDRFLADRRHIVRIIEEVASAIVKKEAVANCKQFEIPATSAFANWSPPVQPPPFRSNGND